MQIYFVVRQAMIDATVESAEKASAMLDQTAAAVRAHAFKIVETEGVSITTQIEALLLEIRSSADQASAQLRVLYNERLIGSLLALQAAILANTTWISDVARSQMTRAHERLLSTYSIVNDAALDRIAQSRAKISASYDFADEYVHELIERFKLQGDNVTPAAVERLREFVDVVAVGARRRGEGVESRVRDLVQQTSDAVADVARSALKQAQPYVHEIVDRVHPLVDRTVETSRPVVERAMEAARPIVQPVMDKTHQVIQFACDDDDAVAVLS